MKTVFKALYAKSIMYGFLILFLFAIVPFRTLTGGLGKGEVRQVEVTGDTMGGLTQYARLYTLGIGISILVQGNFSVKDPKDLAFIKKYQFPTAILSIPLLDSLARFLFNGLKYMYYGEGNLFQVYHFLWIPIIGIFYLYHKYLEKAYENFHPEEKEI